MRVRDWPNYTSLKHAVCIKGFDLLDDYDDALLRSLSLSQIRENTTRIILDGKIQKIEWCSAIPLRKYVNQIKQFALYLTFYHGPNGIECSIHRHSKVLRNFIISSLHQKNKVKLILWFISIYNKSERDETSTSAQKHTHIKLMERRREKKIILLLARTMPSVSKRLL